MDAIRSQDMLDVRGICAKRYKKIPELTIAALDRYVNYRIATGSFLRAVLENDLFEAIGRADSENLAALDEITKLIYNEFPYRCWKTKENVIEFLAGR